MKHSDTRKTNVVHSYIFELPVWLISVFIAIMVLTMVSFVGLILVTGIKAFWPADVTTISWYSIDEEDWTTSAGQIWEAEVLSRAEAEDELLDFQDFGPESIDVSSIENFELWTVKTGNRQLFGQAYQPISNFSIRSVEFDPSIYVIEREEWGDFIGHVRALEHQGNYLDLDGKQLADKFAEVIAQQQAISTQLTALRQHNVAALQEELANINLEITASAEDSTGKVLNESSKQSLLIQQSNLQTQLTETLAIMQQLQSQLDAWHVHLETVDYQTLRLPVVSTFGFYQPNQMNGVEKFWFFVKTVGAFLVDDPRESNSEGGVAPAIFGTILLVFIMTIIVTPLGVITAIYMHEYAQQGVIISTVRILVNNLAGVPSIVFGIFGLGFFVYNIGGSIDALLYADTLPSPTFGTPGLLWSSLTLALLTLPVVIISTEEGLARIPRAVREGSLALGATHWETLKLVILPMASPAVMTGVILAVARAAGEVAPLMLVGVVKLSQQLPLDLSFPFLHLERKFMHLGFHIYDLAFQSPDVESSIPAIYATSLVLMTLVVGLNIMAVVARSKLRAKYKTLEI